MGLFKCSIQLITVEYRHDGTRVHRGVSGLSALKEWGRGGPLDSARTPHFWRRSTVIRDQHFAHGARQSQWSERSKAANMYKALEASPPRVWQKDYACCHRVRLSATLIHQLFESTMTVTVDCAALGRTIDDLCQRIFALRKANRQRRVFIAMAGVPGSGKSTISNALLGALQHNGVRNVAVIPMVSPILLPPRSHISANMDLQGWLPSFES